MAAAAEPQGIFDSIIQTIQDITGIAGNMDTARMNGATAIRQSLDGLRGAITGLKDKATRLQQAITALDSIDDPGVLTAENQRMIDEHRTHLQQISDNLGASGCLAYIALPFFIKPNTTGFVIDISRLPRPTSII